MKYREIRPVMRRFLGAFEAYRKLGFKADDIFCVTAKSIRNNGVLSCFAQLKAQGKEFLIECGPIEVSEETFGAEYKRVSHAVADGEVPQRDLDRIWEESEPYQMKVEFAASLIAKGFKPPKSLS